MTISVTMRTALTDALRQSRDGVACVRARTSTTKALIRRGLAVEDPEKSVILTRTGLLTAARASDTGAELKPGVMVVYDGSRVDDHGKLFVVYQRADDGRYVVREFGYEWFCLRQVRRASIHPTGECAELLAYPSDLD